MLYPLMSPPISSFEAGYFAGLDDLPSQVDWEASKLQSPVPTLPLGLQALPLPDFLPSLLIAGQVLLVSLWSLCLLTAAQVQCLAILLLSGQGCLPLPSGLIPALLRQG